MRKFHWLRTFFRYRFSVLPAIWPGVLLCGTYGHLVCVLHQNGFPVALPIVGSIVPSLVLGLLLVFRTNTAYDRFWEGRKLWENLIGTSRNLTRYIYTTFEVRGPSDLEAKAAALRSIVAYMRAVKQYLRNRPLTPEIADLMAVDEYEFQTLQHVTNPPLGIALRIGHYIQDQYKAKRINIQQAIHATAYLDTLVRALGSCERVLQTPIPLAYSIHLKHLMVLYCVFLPFGFVERLGLWTGPALATIGFTIFGIEAIGLEIEDPFGNDPNDLPLDTICNTMQDNVEDLISLAPTTIALPEELEELALRDPHTDRSAWD